MANLNVLFRHSLFGLMLVMGRESLSLGQGAEPKVDQKYIEVTRWVVELIGNGGRVDEKLGEFDTYLKASDFSVEWMDAHPADNRRAVPRESKVRVHQSSPGKPQEGGSPLPTLKPVEEPIKENDASLADKTIRGTFGSTELEVELKKDGVAVFRSPDSGETIAEGKWSQTGVALSMETQTYRYMGLVTANGLEGKRIKRGDGSSIETWKGSVAKSIPPIKFVPQPVENAEASEVIGIWNVAGIAGLNYDLRADGVAYLNRSPGRWHRNGDSVTIIIGNDTTTYSLSGRTLTAPGAAPLSKMR